MLPTGEHFIDFGLQGAPTRHPVFDIAPEMYDSRTNGR